ncbi:MAG: hypothetical protein JO292_14240, partial [Betaproteobacteria bacterium]|nr:hypothetical protein [Betaproteobacteria bacterium]MBV9362546.1 hypothetical protein [Betaproteobacteria bacterium]
MTTAATVSATNAGAISANVVGASGAAGGSIVVSAVSAQGDTSASSSQPTGATGLSRRLSAALRTNDLGRSYGGALAGAAVNTTTPCDSGSMQVTGTTADNGTGTLNVAYNECRTGSDTINGPATIRIDSFDQANNVITDGTLTITRVNFSGPGLNFGLTGTLRSQINVSAASTTLTTNIVTQDGAGHQTRTQDLVVTNVYDDVKAPTFFTESISGRVFDGTQGYVDVSTQTAPFTAPWGPLYFATSTQSFPDWGIITLTGAASSVKITSKGTNVAKLEVDSNGDGIVDATAHMPWSDFNTAVGADLADNDGDGMHNSFETFYGLNPNSAADKNTDADGDGFSNYTEYLAGTNPASNGSVPSPVRHIWVTGNHDLAVDPATGLIQIFIGSGSGVTLDPVTLELGQTFSGATEPNTTNQTSVTDAQGRTFTLTPTATPTSWTITSSAGGTLTLTGIAGTNPGSL